MPIPNDSPQRPEAPQDRPSMKGRHAAAVDHSRPLSEIPFLLGRPLRPMRTLLLHARSRRRRRRDHRLRGTLRFSRCENKVMHRLRAPIRNMQPVQPHHAAPCAFRKSPARGLRLYAYFQRQERVGIRIRRDRSPSAVERREGEHPEAIPKGWVKGLPARLKTRSRKSNECIISRSSKIRDRKPIPSRRFRRADRLRATAPNRRCAP